MPQQHGPVLTYEEALAARRMGAPLEFLHPTNSPRWSPVMPNESLNKYFSYRLAFPKPGA